MPPQYQSKSFNLLIMLLLFSTAIETKALPRMNRINQDEEKSLEQTLIEGNVAVSKWFEGLAEGVDLFLVDKQIQAGRNETNFRIENTSYSLEGNNFTNETALVINPRFPNLEKYWNLKFTTYDDQEEGRGTEKNYLRQSPRTKNYGATVGLFSKFGKIRTAFQPRIELQNPLNVSQSITFESVADLEDFRINPKLEFFANANKGTGVFQAINFNFILNKELSLTIINEGTYEEKINKFSTTNGLSVGQSLSSSDAMTYSFFVFSNNRENFHLDAYSFSASWYHLFYKKILDLQLTPHLDFNTIRSFTGQAGLTLQLTLNF